MSDLFEYASKEVDDNAAEKAIEELKEESSVTQKDAEDELVQFGGTTETVNEDYEDAAQTKDTEPEITKEEVDNIFGSDWDGTFADMTGLVENYAQDIASQMQYLSSLGEYLSVNKDNVIDDIARSTGIADVKTRIEQIQNNFTCISSNIDNFKTFGFSNGSGDILYNADRTLDNVENIIENSIQLQEHAEEIIDYIQNAPQMIDNIGNYMDGKISQMTEIFSSINTSNLLSTFPQSIIDKFVDTDIVQNLYTMPKKLYDSISNIMLAINSIKAPTSLSSTLTVIKQLKGIINQMRDVQTMLTQGAEIINGIRNNIANGNYVGVLLSAKNAAKFIEKAPSYAAKYPYNYAYETEAGHVFETDNTPGKERLHVRHVSGTDIEMAPSGDVVARVKKDFQTVVDSNMESHVKGKTTILSDGDFEVEGNNINLVTSGNTNISSGDVLLNGDAVSFIVKNASLLSQNNMTLSSNIETSISSGGTLYINAKAGIFIDAPIISIGTATTMLSLNSTTIQEKSSMHNISSGNIRMSGGLITLN